MNGRPRIVRQRVVLCGAAFDRIRKRVSLPMRRGAVSRTSTTAPGWSVALRNAGNSRACPEARRRIRFSGPPGPLHRSSTAALAGEMSRISSRVNSRLPVPATIADDHVVGALPCRGSGWSERLTTSPSFEHARARGRAARLAILTVTGFRDRMSGPHDRERLPRVPAGRPGPRSDSG